MTRTMKKAVSIVLALVMVVTGLNYTPKSVEAATDYTNLTFTEVTGMNGTYAYNVVENTIVSNVPEFHNQNYMKLAYSADNKPEDTTITIDGVKKTTADEEVSQCAMGMTEFYVTALTDNAYHELTVVSTKGTITVVLRKGNPGQLETQPTESTSETETESDEGTAEPIELSALEDAYVYNFTESGEGFKVGFNDPNKKPETEGSTYTYTLKIGDKQIENIKEKGETVDLSGLGLIEDTEYTVTMNAVYKNGDTTVTSPVSAATKFTYKTSTSAAYSDGIPQIFIATSRSNETIGINLYKDASKTKVNAAIMVKGIDGAGVVASDYGTVNVRGNSTSLAQKKAYNFKFQNKYNLFDMGKAKKWSLLANIFDKTLIRNQIGMDFLRTLEETQGDFPDASSKAFTSKCRPVDLYLDGKYLGTYSLIESVETGSSRVNIDIDYAEEDTDEIAEGSVPDTVIINGVTYNTYDTLLELANDSRLDPESYYFKTGLEKFAINEPEHTNKDYNYEPDNPNQPEFVGIAKNFVQGFETALQTNNYDVFSQFIDVDSFVDFYITSELFMTKDINFSSTRFYIRDAKLYAGPLWDLDLSSGNIGDHESAADFWAQGFQWFKLLMNNETFAAKVKERYAQIQPQIKKLYSAGGAVDRAYDEIKISAIRNYENAYNIFSTETADGLNNGWGYTYVYGTNGSWDQKANPITAIDALNRYGVYGSVKVFDDYASYISDYKTWLKNRNTWLLNNWNIELNTGVYKDKETKDIIAAWDAVDGATGYAITYTPAASQMSTLSLFSKLTDNGLIMPQAEGDMTETVYITDGAVTQYNFTDNGILLKDGSIVSVAYTTDAIVDSSSNYINVLAEEVAAELSIMNRVVVEGLVATITTEVTNNGTAAADNLTLELKGKDGTVIDTKTITSIEANATGTVIFERTETAGSYTYTITAGAVTSGVVYECNDPESLEYVSDATLSANKAGALYAVLGSIPGQSFGFDANGYQITTGATDQAIRIRLNGEIAASNDTGNSSMNYNAKYSKLKSGMTNVLQIEWVDRASDGVTYTTHIQTVYIKVPEAEINPDQTWTYTESSHDGVLADTVDGLNNYVRYEAVKASATSGNANNAIDNNAESRWTSESKIDPQEFIVDLGAEYSVKEFLIRWERASAKDFTVELSTDGQNYTTAASITGASHENNRLDIIVLNEEAAARYVKIKGTARNESNYGYSIYEMGIYGPEAEKESAPDQDIDIPTDWIQIGTRKAADGSTYYVSKSVLQENGGFFTPNLRELYSKDIDCYNGALGDKPSYVTAIPDESNKMKTVWIDGKKYTSGTENVYLNGDQIHIAQSLFTLPEGVNEKIYIVTVRALKDYTYALRVVGDVTVTTTPNETTLPAITEIPPLAEGDIPAEAEGKWTQLGDSEYYYYVPSGNTDRINNVINNPDDIQVDIGVIGAPFKRVQVNNTDIEIDPAAARTKIKKTYMAQYGVYRLDILAANGTDTAQVYIKKEKISDYRPTGLLASVSGGNVNVNWTASDDAVADGCTYKVTFNETTVSVIAPPAAFSLEGVAYGEYNVTLETYKGEELVDTQTATVNYKEPGTVESTLTVTERWEARRWEVLSWTEVTDATAYAIYADGKLFTTTDDLTYNLPAYAFANTNNANGQPTTVGKHNVKVVALFNNEDAKATYEETDSKHLIGSDDAELYVNYVYGNGTDIWNKNDIRSPWNFTICESVTDQITKAADAVVNYDTDGAAMLTLNSVGKHAGNDQAWTIKAALYDEEITVGEMIDLSFDITGPASLIGKTIKIKCTPEECNEDGTYGEAVYEEAEYTFEDDGEGGAVLHYSNSFTATNSTYDLLFGLGMLDDDIDLVLSDTSVTKVYGVKAVMPSAELNADDHTQNGILVNWTSDVPNHMRDDYMYKVLIGDVTNTDAEGNVILEEATLPEGSDSYVSGLTYPGYDEGTYKVVVECYYDGAVTSMAEGEVTIEYEDAADLVITDISIPDKEFHIGETVPISITMKNIGTINATPDTGNLAVHLHVNDTDATKQERGYYTVSDLGHENTLAPGESITGTIDYKIKDEDHAGDYLFSITAEADSDKKVTESNDEHNGINNNLFTKVFRFFAPIGLVEMTNDGTDIHASWPEHDATNAKFILRYTDAASGEIFQIETADNTPNITFPKGVTIANNSEVVVISVHTDGSSHTYAKGTALADLKLTEVSVDGPVFIGQAKDVKTVVENVGVAVATGEEQNLFGVKIEDTGKYATQNAVCLAPNQQLEMTISKGIPEDAYTVEGKYTLWAEADDGAGRIPETDDYLGNDKTRNNYKDFDIIVLNKGELVLENVEGAVTAEWSQNTELTVDGYQLTYTSNGVTKTVDVAGTENTYVFTEPLDNNTDVIIAAKYAEADENYYAIAEAKALADLVITAVSVPEKIYINEAFNMEVTFKNNGTAQVDSTVDDMEHYGKWLITSIQPNKNFSENALIQNHTVSGLLAGASDTVTLENIKGTVLGKYNLDVKVDAPGFAEAENNGFITESDETNNIYPQTVLIEERSFVQEKMDWEPLVSNAAGHEGEVYNFDVGGSSQQAHIYYKILDTSVTYKHYIDIIPNRTGYGGSYMSMHWFDGYSPINEIKQAGPDNLPGITDTKISMALIKNMKEETLNNAVYEQIALQNFDYISPDGDESKNIPSIGGASAFIVNGNGFNYNANNFGLYKYYLMKIERADGEYVTIAYKVTDENDEMNSWIQSKPNKGQEATNPDRLPFYYHDTSCETIGSFWYDTEDLKLSSISCYNGNYLAMHISDTIVFGEHYKIEMAYAGVDEEGEFIVPTEGFKEVPIYNKEGTNTLQLQLPTMMKELPVHSDMAGAVDSEYYFMKLYYDLDDNPDEYVKIPVRVNAVIPRIEEINGLTVSARGGVLSVLWTNTATQDAHGYLYDIYIDGDLVSENVPAGAYNYEGYDLETIGKEYNIRVVAKWCDQITDAAMTYKIEEPKDDFETLPGEDITYPEDIEKWVLISGEYILPIHRHGTISREVNAKIYYYTDDDLNSVVGYNGSYIALNGSTEYFTGNSGKIFVQDGDSTTFVSKGTYDNFYPGKTLMQSAKMFSTYGNWQNGDTLYYTVKVVGDNGNTAKNFYFKVVPTDEEYAEPADGEWREISGQSKLPVKMGNTSLEGTVYFYDYESKTNTYDIVGYNGYYMSIIGKNNYYTGTGTTIEISEAMDDTAIETNTSDILDNIVDVDYGFTSREIADKVYAGQIIIKSEDTFTVAYGTTYYLLKVNGADGDGNETTTYVPIKVVVNTGDVEVQGFQMNTDTSIGAVAEYNPSFRVVSKSSKVMAIDNKLYEVKGYGTVYALEADIDGNYGDMVIGGGDNIRYFQTTNVGTLNGYTAGTGDEKYYNYYALTFKHEKYNYASLTEKYAFRAYAVLDNGTEEGIKVYGENVYSVNMQEIAENLYQNNKMSTKTAHDFLYDNVLNLIAMSENTPGICKAMYKALDVTDTSNPNYNLINYVNYDIFDYTRCRGEYTYADHGNFICKRMGENESQLLDQLNDAAGTNHATIYDWVYNETEKYANSQGVHYKGMYKVVDYDWENNVYTKFDSEQSGRK